MPSVLQYKQNKRLSSDILYDTELDMIISFYFFKIGIFFKDFYDFFAIYLISDRKTFDVRAIHVKDTNYFVLNDLKNDTNYVVTYLV